MKANFKNIIELVEYFGTEEICTQFLKSIIWSLNNANWMYLKKIK
jgi:hypothetical protein